MSNSKHVNMAMAKDKFIPPNKRRMLETDLDKKVPDEYLCLVKEKSKQNV